MGVPSAYHLERTAQRRDFWASLATRDFCDPRGLQQNCLQNVAMNENVELYPTATRAKRQKL